MRSPTLVGLTCLIGSLVACAKGGDFAGAAGNGNGGDGNGSAQGGGGSGGSPTTSTSGGGGATGSTTDTTTTTDTGTTSTTTTSTTTTTTTTSTTTTTTTTTMCSESPCKLAPPQCGCAAGQACTLNGDLANECQPAGNLQVGQSCLGANDCVAGALCTNVSASQANCSQLCDNDATCGNALCVIELVDANQAPIPGVTLCSDNCTPIGNVGCGAGLGCLLGQEQDGQMRTFGICRGVGNVAQGGTCSGAEDCSAGSACFTVNGANECLTYCNFNSPSCPAGTTCADLAVTYKGISYGACL